MAAGPSSQRPAGQPPAPRAAGSAAPGGLASTTASAPAGGLVGLTDAEAKCRLDADGANAMPETAVHPVRGALQKLWAPIPWMLEAAIVLELLLDRRIEAAVIAVLLGFNALLGLFQESRAQATLAALKSRLALTAVAVRSGAWRVVPARELVVGDIIKLSLGVVVAADVRLTEGEVLLDQSTLTGESIPVEAGAGTSSYAGAQVRRGEAVGQVTATGIRTKFGRTAELVRTAHVVSSEQKTVFRVVRNLAAFNGVVIVALASYAFAIGMSVAEVVPLVLTAVLASIPVALPATFTLAAALGARALARNGVLPTRLSSVDEAGAIGVLCADKTGTLTRNELAVTEVSAFDGFDRAHVLGLAALASSDGGQDPVDAAILAAARATAAGEVAQVVSFVPFDPATKMSEATVTEPGKGAYRVVKGAFAAVGARIDTPAVALTEARRLEDRGFRVLAVAVGPAAPLTLAGLIALSDPPRGESAGLVTELHALGVRVVMVTGDAPVTAAIVARAVGLEGAVSPPGPFRNALDPAAFAVFAGVLPEDKFALVKAFQRSGNTVGMCGDGANDAPALRQAQMGIAVASATDVAKAAAGMVLTEPGLGGIVAAVKEGRKTFQRILTYALNSITKKTVQVLFLGAGLLMTRHAILTPLLMVLIMITGDFLGMSLTSDNVTPSPKPNAWRVNRLTVAGITMGLFELGFCVGGLAAGLYVLRYPIDTLRTLAFIVLVFGNQATTYTNRTRGSMWSPHPSLWVGIASLTDVAVASILATLGIAMAPLPAVVVLLTLASAAAFAVLLDLIKVPVFRFLKVS